MKSNKGFTVVELLASFVLTMIIVVFLFEIVLELKNVYVNESIRTEIINKNAVIATALHNKFENEFILDVSNISVGKSSIKVNNQTFTYPKDVEIINPESAITISSSTGDYANNSYIRIHYKVESANLDKPITFNYIYTYHS